MSWSTDAVHALLPMVQKQSAAALEAQGQQAFLSGLQLGYRAGLLELLRVVSGARTS